MTAPPPDAPASGALSRLAARPLLVSALLFALASALYVNAIGNAFVFDDLSTFASNRLIRSWDGLWTLLTVRSPSTYRPIRYISFALDYAISGQDPWAYHVLNGLYHGGVATLAFFLLRRLAASATAALAGALLFVAHPAHTEAVAYISGRRDLLTGIFYTGAFLCFLRWRHGVASPGSGSPSDDHPPRLRHLWLVACAALFALGLGAKEMAVTLPVMLLLHEVLLGGGVRGLSRALRERPLLRILLGGGLAFAALYAYKVATGHTSGQRGLWGGTLDRHLANSVVLVAHYVELCVFPATLLADYSAHVFPIPASLGEPRVLRALAVVVGLAAASVALARRDPRVAFGIAWFLVTLSPMAQLVPFHEVGADRHIYLPSIGFCLIAGLAFDRAGALLRPRGEAIAAALPALALGALLLVSGARVLARNAEWRTPESIYRATAAAAPTCARAQLNVGSVLATRGAKALEARDLREGQARLREALPYYTRAIELVPDYVFAHVQRARIHRLLGGDAEARADLERALAIALATEAAGDPSPVDSTEILLQLGRFEDVLQRAAVKLDRNSWGVKVATYAGRASEGLAGRAEAAGRREEARARLEAALDWYGRAVGIDPCAYYALGRAYALSARLGPKERAAAWKARVDASEPAREAREREARGRAKGAEAQAP